MVMCATCGRENPGDARFCNGCGAPLGAAPQPRREERRVVTVLFADLVGFTSRAERMDPEDVRALLAPYWQHLRDELEHFGGTVEKFIGDAVMALFGAPVAHEDDPERAVRAALAIRDWVRESGEDLQVRIAVNTGEALVLLGARPAEGEGMAAGDVVNTAARLQAAAPVNGVLVGETTYRATRPVIEFHPAEPVVAKGKAEPVPVWEAMAARSRATIEIVSAAPLVGRRDELDLLRRALDRARHEREPQLVTLVGVPGIGKSRLVAELYALADADEQIIGWRRGRSLSYGEGISLWALGEVVKAELGVLESDSREETAAKLSSAIGELVTDEAERLWLERQLAPLVGLPSTAGERQERFGAWRRWIEALAERRPLVLVFEDLQWADDELLDFVDELAEWATGVPLLIVCTTRPELYERRPGWGGGKRNALTISLGRLEDADTARIVAAALERSVLPAETQAELLARADGNPLYAEQYARMLAEGGGTEALPETVQGIIAARLDLLTAEEKSLLQDAAVVGRAFWPGPLGTSGELLRSLVRKEFARRERRSSIAGEEEYSFAHALVRDVAYAQIPRAERAAKHRAAADWIDTLPADRAADRAEMVAHHYGAALELAVASGLVDEELRRRARDAFRDAGERASSLNAFATAERHLVATFELVPEGDPERPRILLALGRVVAERDPAAGTPLLEEAAKVIFTAGDATAAASAEIACAQACFQGGFRDAADEHSQRALALLEGEPLSEVKVEAFAERARLLMLSSAYTEAAELATAGLGLAERIGAERPQASLLITRGTSVGGRADVERGLEIADRQKDLLQLSRGFNNLAELVIGNGDLEAAFGVYARGRREFEQLGLTTHLLWLDVQEASITVLTDAWDRALELIEPVLSRLDAGSTHYLEGGARGIRARIRYARGDTSGGLADAERGLAADRSAKDPQALVPALGSFAGLLAREGRRDEARSLLDEALAVCREVPVLYYSLAPNLLLAVLDVGRQPEFFEVFEPQARRDPWTTASVTAWRGDLVDAAEILARHGARFLEADVRVRAAAQLRADGDTATADEQLARALAFFRTVGAAQRIREAEALLPASA
jgi:class 3 adenylate cyclase/tetratricopeptide (TPR) repeat protein